MPPHVPPCAVPVPFHCDPKPGSVAEVILGSGDVVTILLIIVLILFAIYLVKRL